MPTIEVQVRRFSVISTRPFEEVVRALTATIGQPDMKAFHSAVVGHGPSPISKTWFTERSDRRI